MTLKQLTEKRREQFMEHVSPQVKERLENPKQITLTEWQEFRGNSYERKLLMKKLNNEAFLYLLEYCMGQAGYSEYGQYELSRCYNDAVTNELVPEMIKRFKEKTELLKTWKERLQRFENNPNVANGISATDALGIQSARVKTLQDCIKELEK